MSDLILALTALGYTLVYGVLKLKSLQSIHEAHAPAKPPKEAKAAETPQSI